ncbi:MAG: M24 family metallopeptidase [Actinomycetes bacterium]
MGSPRTDALLRAQDRASALFDDVEARGLIRSGVSESQLSKEIRDLARTTYGVTRHWHKRIARSGPNTLRPYDENPPDRVIGTDDIVFLDFGPIFAEWEADFGRTYVLGTDVNKLRLRDDLAAAFAAGADYFRTHPQITGAELYAFLQDYATTLGWTYGGPIAGHLVGKFPHQRVPGDKVLSYIAPGNDEPMRSQDRHGNDRHWILEIHFIDRERQIGGFYEELLTTS